MKKYVTLFVIMALMGCATVPVPRLIQNAWIIDQGFDEAWTMTLETLTEMGMTPERFEKDSGLIITEAVAIRGNNKSGPCDCGKLAFTQFESHREATFTVLVKAINENKSEIKIIGDYKVYFTDSIDAATQSRLERMIHKQLYVRPCVSTGKVEVEFYSKIVGQS